MRKDSVVLLLIMVLLAVPGAYAVDGLVRKPSSRTVAQTMDSLQQAVRAKGLVVVARTAAK